MPFTVAELENIANAAIDFHFQRGKVHSQTLQDKPLLALIKSRQKTFPGGKDNITVRVKGEYTGAFQGFSHDDQVSYVNPTNIRTATYPWKLIHNGIQFTMHELLKDGISITDSTTGKGEVRHSERELTALANLLDDKLEELDETTERGMNEMFWKDGTSDSDLVPGLQSIIVNDPTSATVVGGIDQSANDWWRNRAELGISASTPGDLNITHTLQTEFRQLRRFGGRPSKGLAGSDFLEAWEKELRSKGDFTQDGWAKSGRIDASITDIAFKGVPFDYDPTLDDLGRAKYAYVIDPRRLFPMVMENQDMAKHKPARPEDRYVFYRAVTWVGGLVCNQRNAHGVYSIA
jgi:hypothetical protein